MCFGGAEKESNSIEWTITIERFKFFKLFFIFYFNRRTKQIKSYIFIKWMIWNGSFGNQLIIIKAYHIDFQVRVLKNSISGFQHGIYAHSWSVMMN